MQPITSPVSPYHIMCFALYGLVSLSNCFIRVSFISPKTVFTLQRQGTRQLGTPLKLREDFLDQTDQETWFSKRKMNARGRHIHIKCATSVVLKSPDTGIQLSELKSQPCHLLALWLWANLVSFSAEWSSEYLPRIHACLAVSSILKHLQLLSSLLSSPPPMSPFPTLGGGKPV